MKNVLLSAAPAGITDYVTILGGMLLAPVLGIPDEQIATIATIVMGSVGLIMLFLLCQPFNAIRRALIIAMTAIFVLGGLLFPGFFALTALQWRGILLTAGLVIIAVPMLLLLMGVTRKLRNTPVKKKAY